MKPHKYLLLQTLDVFRLLKRVRRRRRLSKPIQIWDGRSIKRWSADYSGSGAIS